MRTRNAAALTMATLADNDIEDCSFCWANGDTLDNDKEEDYADEYDSNDGDYDSNDGDRDNGNTIDNAKC